MRHSVGQRQSARDSGLVRFRVNGLSRRTALGVDCAPGRGHSRKHASPEKEIVRPSPEYARLYKPGMFACTLSRISFSACSSSAH